MDERGEQVSYKDNSDKDDKDTKEGTADTAENLPAKGPLSEANLLLDFLPDPETDSTR